jgi:predicted  nucleic acid-binding Zn-ribbon protein
MYCRHGINRDMGSCSFCDEQDEMRKKIEELETKLDALKQQFEDQVNEMKGELEQLRTRQSGIEEAIGELNIRLEALEGSHDD